MSRRKAQKEACSPRHLALLSPPTFPLAAKPTLSLLSLSRSVRPLLRKCVSLPFLLSLSPIFPSASVSVTAQASTHQHILLHEYLQLFCKPAPYPPPPSACIYVCLVVPPCVQESVHLHPALPSLSVHAYISTDSFTKLICISGQFSALIPENALTASMC